MVLVAKFEFFQSSEAVGDLVKCLLRLYLEQGRRVHKLDRPLYNEVTDLLHHYNFLLTSKQVIDLHKSDDSDGLGVGLAVGVYEAEEVEEDGKTLSEIRIFHLLHFLIIKIIINQKCQRSGNSYQKILLQRLEVKADIPSLYQFEDDISEHVSKILSF